MSSKQLLGIQNYLFKTIRSYVVAHLVGLEILAVIMAVALVMSRLPYFNILISGYMVFFIFLAGSVVLLHVRTKVVLVSALCLFVFGLCFTIIGKMRDAESIGNLVYFVLWLTCIMSVSDVMHDR